MGIGDRVKIINAGTIKDFRGAERDLFNGHEGLIEKVDDTNHRVTVMISIFGRQTPVEVKLEQVELV